MQKILGITIALICMLGIVAQAQAAPKAGKTNKANTPAREKLVLLPIIVSAEIRQMQSNMESAVIQGMEKKYVVYSGERVLQELKKATSKENARTKKDCDETRCLEDVAVAFQTDNFARVDITKIDGGYLLSINVKDIGSNESVYNNSLTCKNCDAFEVIEKLKELGGTTVQPSPQANTEEPPVAITKNNSESELWAEVKEANSVEYYSAYLKQYPKGKFSVLAQSNLNKFKNEAVAEAAQQEKGDWDNASRGTSVESFEGYLAQYPKGQYATLATARITKLKKEAAILAAQAPKPSKANKSSKERLVLMPLGVPLEDKSLSGSMEAALVEGLQPKYEVFAGESVAKVAFQIKCDETRCMQDIAAAFQAEFIAIARVTKMPDGYFLALSVQNIFDNKIVYSRAIPCQQCNIYQVNAKLKELGGAE